MKYLMNRKRKTGLYSAAIVAGIGLLGGGSTLSAAEAPAATATAPQYQAASPKPEAVVQSAPLSFTDKDNNTYTVGPDGKLVKTPAPQKVDNPVFAAFTEWIAKYNTAVAPQKKSLEAEGVRLATERRAVLAELIQSDPQRAIELSVDLPQRQALPAAVVQQLEEVLQGRGDNSVTASFLRKPRQQGEAAAKLGTPSDMTVTSTLAFSFEEKTYAPFFYGRRNGISSKHDLPFHGVAVDGNLAISESPLRILSQDEAIPAGATPDKNGTNCPVCGKPAANGIRGVVGNTVYYFDTTQDAGNFTRQLEAAE